VSPNIKEYPPLGRHQAKQTGGASTKRKPLRTANIKGNPVTVVFASALCLESLRLKGPQFSLFFKKAKTHG